MRLGKIGKRSYEDALRAVVLLAETMGIGREELFDYEDGRPVSISPSVAPAVALVAIAWGVPSDTVLLHVDMMLMAYGGKRDAYSFAREIVGEAGE